MTKMMCAPLSPAVAEAEVVRLLGGSAATTAEEPVIRPRRGPRKRPGLTIADVEAALRACSGIKQQAAVMLKVDRSQITRMCQKHPKLEAVIAETIEAVIDLAEARLIENIRAGDLSSIRYFLDNRGGARGYGRKILPEGAAMVVKISGSDAEL